MCYSSCICAPTRAPRTGVVVCQNGASPHGSPARSVHTTRNPPRTCCTHTFCKAYHCNTTLNVQTRHTQGLEASVKATDTDPLPALHPATRRSHHNTMRAQRRLPIPLPPPEVCRLPLAASVLELGLHGVWGKLVSAWWHGVVLWVHAGPRPHSVP